MEAVAERVRDFIVATPRLDVWRAHCLFSLEGSRMGLDGSTVALTNGFHTVHLDHDTLRPATLRTTPADLQPLPLSDSHRRVALIGDAVAISHRDREVARIPCQPRDLGLRLGALYVLDRYGTVIRYVFS